MNKDLFSPAVQAFLHEQAGVDPAALALGKSPFATVSAQELAQQVDGRQRIRRKLPQWHSTTGIFYPEKLALEQASSETTARYKASLINPVKRLADLTGGLGVDTYYLAQRAERAVHCERNAALSAIAAHNATILGATNIVFEVVDGIAYVQTMADNSLDLVYIDPSRRVEQRKVFRLEDCEPNVVEAQAFLLQKATSSMIKCAPMLDITAARGSLTHIREIHVVSVGNECKELLFILDRAHQGETRFVAASLTNGIARTFTFFADEEQSAASVFGNPDRFLYEPDAAVLKSGAFKLVGSRFNLKKLHRHTHLYTAAHHNTDFIGKIFVIDDVMPYRTFKKQQLGLQAHVSTRNFPIKPEELRKRHRISEGTDNYLYFCTAMDETPIVIFASKS